MNPPAYRGAGTIGWQAPEQVEFRDRSTLEIVKAQKLGEKTSKFTGPGLPEGRSDGLSTKAD